MSLEDKALELGLAGFTDEEAVKNEEEYTGIVNILIDKKDPNNKTNLLICRYNEEYTKLYFTYDGGEEANRYVLKAEDIKTPEELENIYNTALTRAREYKKLALMDPITIEIK